MEAMDKIISFYIQLKSLKSKILFLKSTSNKNNLAKSSPEQNHLLFEVQRNQSQLCPTCLCP